MQKSIPTYLNLKQNVISLVVGTAVFAELFILIFRPFNSADWVKLLGAGDWAKYGDWIYLGFATLAVLVAMGIIAISRTIMYKYAKKRAITYWQYGIWILAEVTAMSLVYTIFALFVLQIGGNFFGTLERAIGYTACILLIPYAFFMLYFSMRDKGQQLQQIQQTWREKLSLLNTSKGEEPDPMLNFKDEKGELRLSIRTSACYFLTSADNYVIVNYMSAGKMQKFTFRSTLKRIEDEFRNQQLVRCHRSFIVNLDNVKILRKGEEGLMLDFDRQEIPSIPVSKTYSNGVLKRFGSSDNLGS